MNRGRLILLGVFSTLATSWWGLVVAPQLQLGNQQPVALRGTTQAYPPGRPGLAVQGEQVYRANGCLYCHTQQVRTAGAGAVFRQGSVARYVSTDIERGWGKRFSVAEDYLRDHPVMIGHRRVGPDLTNVGVRQPNDETQTNLLWHLRHLYEPVSVAKDSAMPAYRFLFEKRRLKPGQEVATNALAWIERDGISEIVPKPEAVALAAYLFSLDSDAPLFEAPLPAPPKPTPDSNAPAAPVNNGPVE
jgi:cytochrome c oxidase cbb3-type subunit 2